MTIRAIVALALIASTMPAAAQVHGARTELERPERDYRSGPLYPPQRLDRTDRVYRGQDGRLYCRRSDGTTGLIVGGVAGAVSGALLAKGQSRTLGALLGGAVGAAIGQSVDRGEVTCR